MYMEWVNRITGLRIYYMNNVRRNLQWASIFTTDINLKIPAHILYTCFYIYINIYKEVIYFNRGIW